MILLLLTGCFFDFVHFKGKESAAPDSGAEGEVEGEGEGEGEPGGGGGEVTWSWGDQLTVEDAGASFVGEVIGDWAGGHLEAIGDINGDGFGDLAIGAPFNSEGATGGGKVYFVNGRSTGWSLDESLAPYPSVIGDTESDQLSGVVPLGDLNGDGLADVALTLGYSSVVNRDGLPMMYGNSGTWVSSLPSSEADVLLYNSTYDWTTTGDDTAFTLGDMNGDGLDDWAVYGMVLNTGELHVMSGADVSAETWVPDDGMFWVHGDETTTNWSYFTLTGDVNGDGLSDVLSRHADGTDLMIFLGATSGLPMDAQDTDAMDGQIVHIGGLSEKNVLDDINGDEADDITVSVANTDSDSELGTYLYFGREGWSVGLGLADADVHIGGARVHTGTSLGDIDGDGIGDLGVLQTDSGSDPSAEVYVYLGREDWGAELGLADADVHITPAATVDDTLELPVRDLLGDVNGDGRGDVLLRAKRATVDGVEYAGSASLFVGRAAWEPLLSTDDADLTFAGSAVGQKLGTSEWVTVDDLDGDLCDDIAFASARHPVHADGEDYDINEGAVFVFFGQPGP